MDTINRNNKLEILFRKYPSPQKSDLGKILSDAQNEFGYLSEEVLKKVATYVGVSATETYGFASFYSMYNLEKPGKYVIKICKGTACHIKSASRIISEIENSLGTKAGETTKDGLFKFEVSSCLGICALSPVIMINDKIYSRVNSKIVKSLIDELKSEEGIND